MTTKRDLRLRLDELLTAQLAELDAVELALQLAIDQVQDVRIRRLEEKEREADGPGFSDLAFQVLVGALLTVGLEAVAVGALARALAGLAGSRRLVFASARVTRRVEQVALSGRSIAAAARITRKEVELAFRQPDASETYDLLFELAGALAGGTAGAVAQAAGRPALVAPPAPAPRDSPGVALARRHRTHILRQRAYARRTHDRIAHAVESAGTSFPEDELESFLAKSLEDREAASYAEGSEELIRDASLLFEALIWLDVSGGLGGLVETFDETNPARAPSAFLPERALAHFQHPSGTTGGRPDHYLKFGDPALWTYLTARMEPLFSAAWRDVGEQRPVSYSLEFPGSPSTYALIDLLVRLEESRARTERAFR